MEKKKREKKGSFMATSADRHDFEIFVYQHKVLTDTWGSFPEWKETHMEYHTLDSEDIVERIEKGKYLIKRTIEGEIIVASNDPNAPWIFKA